VKLTPEQEALKQAAQTAHANQWCRAMSNFDALASPEVVLTLLAQLEAAQEAAGEICFGPHVPLAEYI
jgi:hypothetical protein